MILYEDPYHDGVEYFLSTGAAIGLIFGDGRLDMLLFVLCLLRHFPNSPFRLRDD